MAWTRSLFSVRRGTRLALDRAKAVKGYIKSLSPAAQFKAMKSAALTTAGAQFRNAVGGDHL